jgi:hypothetical protein
MIISFYYYLTQFSLIYEQDHLLSFLIKLLLLLMNITQQKDLILSILINQLNSHFLKLL